MLLVIVAILSILVALYFIVKYFERCEIGSQEIVMGFWAAILFALLLGLSISVIALDKTEESRQYELYKMHDQLEALYLKDPTNPYTLNEIKRHNDSVSWFIHAQDNIWIGVLVPDVYSEDMLVETNS